MIQSDLFEAYEAALHGNIELMRKAFDELMREVEAMEPYAARRYIRQAYQAIVAKYGAYASVAALEFYEINRAQATLKTAYNASAFVPEIDKLLEFDVTAAMSMSTDIQKLLDRLFGNATERVMQYADETITQNAAYDPAHPMWALVPHANACGWCQMIASRGFDYYSKKSAGNTRHPNCKCTPVAEFDTKNPRLDGYDPSKLEEKYRKARETLNEDEIWKEWDSLNPQEQKKYGGKRRGGYDHFLRNKIVYAMDDMSN